MLTDRLYVLGIFSTGFYFISKITVLLIILYLAGCFASRPAYRSLYSISGISALSLLSAFTISWVVIRWINVGRYFAAKQDPYHNYWYYHSDPNTSLFRLLLINNIFLGMYLLGLLAASVAAFRIKHVSRLVSCIELLDCY